MDIEEQIAEIEVPEGLQEKIKTVAHELGRIPLGQRLQLMMGDKTPYNAPEPFRQYRHDGFEVVELPASGFASRHHLSVNYNGKCVFEQADGQVTKYEPGFVWEDKLEATHDWALARRAEREAKARAKAQ